jgi:peptidoglycan/xylan/chitin deacetylase (PgdA/CDA1 family)
MFKLAKRTVLGVFRKAGIFEVVGRSTWRKQRLLVLCYHGVSIDDEHRWNSSLYVSQDHLASRLDLLRAHGCNVLPFPEAVQRLYAGELPERSVAITFDDGTYDFYSRALPLFVERDMPVTVYLTTYHCDHNVPVFRLACSYMLWKRRDSVFRGTGSLAEMPAFDLSTKDGRRQALVAIDGVAQTARMTAAEKHEFAAEIAQALDVDYDEICERRILHIMRPEEVTEAARRGADVQLHTHRHRTPAVEDLFLREIRDNRKRIREIIESEATHFCYPSGNHRPEFLDWLASEGVVSATTCEPGLATRSSHRLLLPRIIDHDGLNSDEFEGWLFGVSQFLPRRKVHGTPFDESGVVQLAAGFTGR